LETVAGVCFHLPAASSNRKTLGARKGGKIAFPTIDLQNRLCSSAFTLASEAILEPVESRSLPKQIQLQANSFDGASGREPDTRDCGQFIFMDLQE
jgi:hypothetical protein